MELAVTREGQFPTIFFRVAGYCPCGDTGCPSRGTGYKFGLIRTPAHEPLRRVLTCAVALVKRHAVRCCSHASMALWILSGKSIGGLMDDVS
jgi:hypothetical protein